MSAWSDGATGATLLAVEFGLLYFSARHLAFLRQRELTLQEEVSCLAPEEAWDSEFILTFRELTGEANVLWALVRAAPKQLSSVCVLGSGALGIIGLLGGPGTWTQRSGLLCFALGALGWAYSSSRTSRIESGVSAIRDQIRRLSREVERKLTHKSGPGR